jgi:hypothetical protein
MKALIFALLLTSQAAFASCDETLTGIRFLTEATGKELNAFGNRLASTHQDFQAWLANQDTDWLTLEDAAKYELLGRYYSEKLRDYKEVGGRGDQLEIELRHRGASIEPGLHGYAHLHALSAENYSRQIVRFTVMFFTPIDSAFPEAQVDDVLSEIELVYVHNTTGLFKRPSAPLLSSRELTAMGIDGKLNTAEFNREILKTDGNVYFYAIPHVKSAPFPEVVSPYGNVNLVLNPIYAETYGWASPYLMRPEDLDKLRMPIRHLHEWDFKPSDLLKLIRNTFRVSLLRLWREDRAEFDRVLAALKKGDDLLPLMREYSLGRLGIPFEQIHNGLELKVPIAVAPEALDIRLTREGFSPLIPKGPMLHRWEMP